ncbi:MAG: MBL fold metallo-hydrolase [Patescibacteria group bacterium]|nr:MBL fold metallo-hydrolase [Patescibacteria group bacterium]
MFGVKFVVMEVTYLGHSCFKVDERRGQNGSVSLIVDPYDAGMVGFGLKKGLTADLVLVTHSHGDHNFVSAVSGSPFVIAGPGEYEVKGVKVTGVKSFHDEQEGKQRGLNTIYSWLMGGVSFCHLGDLGQVLSDNQINEIGKVDVLFVPVGGFYTIDAKKAIEVVNQLEPLVVVPMHYKRTELSANLQKVLAPVSDFTKEFGQSVKSETVLKVAKDSLPLEMEVIVLEKSS